jgi:hypothetical protein
LTDGRVEDSDADTGSCEEFEEGVEVAGDPPAENQEGGVARIAGEDPIHDPGLDTAMIDMESYEAEFGCQPCGNPGGIWDESEEEGSNDSGKVPKDSHIDPPHVIGPPGAADSQPPGDELDIGPDSEMLPPAPPNAKAKPKARAKEAAFAARDSTLKYYSEDKQVYFRWDCNAGNLNVHCNLHENCCWDKTLSSSANLNRSSQGRSVGLQLAWFFAAKNNPELVPDRAAHKRLTLTAEKGSQYYTLAVRKALREWSHTQPEFVTMHGSNIERRRRTNAAGEVVEPDEPLGVAF